jgi:putative transposase
MVKEDTKVKVKEEIKTHIRAYKLKLQPNKIQKEMFSKWIGCHRFTYNKAISTFNNKKDTLSCYDEFKLRNRFVIKSTNSKRKKPSEKELLSKQKKIEKKREQKIKEEQIRLKKEQDLKEKPKKTNKKKPIKIPDKVKKIKRIRKKKLGSINNFFNNKKWLEECPSDIRKDAIKEACTALKAAITNLKNKNITHFKATFKSKKKQKSNGWSMKFCKEHVKKDNCKLKIYSNTFKVCNKRQLNKLINNDRPEKDCEIIKDKFGDYFLIVKKEIEIAPKTNTQKLVSIDPGIRKYLTTYSPDQKESFLIAANYEQMLLPVLLNLDELYSQKTKVSGKKLITLKKKIIQQRKKIHNMKKEAIHQVSNFITKKYDIILMPKLGVTSMSLKNNRTLTTKTVRNMMSMCHCELFDEIERKSFQRGKTFLKVFEQLTSQTCPNCGHTHKSSSETKICPSCSFIFDRDIVGALNILLKAVRKQ